MARDLDVFRVEYAGTFEECAWRETKEECGIAITQMEKVGIHEFEFFDKRGDILEVHVFRVND